VASKAVQGEGLRTTFSGAPRVSFLTDAESAWVKVELAFTSSPMLDGDGITRQTVLGFDDVFYFCWNGWDFHLKPSNPSDVELGLIEIRDSEILSEVFATGRYWGGDPHHYRITFDDHGTYDVGCRTLDVSYGASRRRDEPPSCPNSMPAQG
jgi:hypothetical protein